MLYVNKFNWTGVANLAKQEGTQCRLVEFLKALEENWNDDDVQYDEVTEELFFILDYQTKYLNRDMLTALKNVDNITIFDAVDHHQLIRKLEEYEEYDILGMLHEDCDDFDLYTNDNRSQFVYYDGWLVEREYLHGELRNPLA